MASAFTSVEHYENFPVASFVLPARLRRPVAVIYAFAREADDIADEGDAPPDARLADLAARADELDRIERGEPPRTPLYTALAQTIHEFRLPLAPFRDLLDAFRQDVSKTRYTTFDEVLDYCRRSANPVGRLLMHLFGDTAERHLAMSDAICTSLQLINFLQDIAIDHSRGRIYLPQDSLASFGVTEAQIGAATVDDAWRALMAFEIGRTRSLLDFGTPLGRALPGRIGLELRLIAASGGRILDRIESVGGDVFRRRPTLGARDALPILWRAIVR
jgi:squalene synthase HpnC